MKAILITAALLMLGACASSGKRIDVSQLGDLHTGQTTLAEVVHKYGRPNLLSKNWDGTQTAAYAATESGSDAANALPVVGAVVSRGSAGADSVIFYFDNKGVLTDFKLPRASTAASTQAASSAQVQSNAPAATPQSAATVAPSRAKPETAPASPARKRDDGLPFWLPSDSKDARF